MPELTTRTFDYTELDADTRTTLQAHATRFRALAQDAALGLWQMGEILADAQERLAQHGYGTFQQWIESETGVGIRTAYRLMNVYRRFDCANLSQTSFATSALYVLSEPSTPPEAREEALWRALRGEAISHEKAKEMAEAYQYRPEPMVRTPEYDAYERDVLLGQLGDAGKPTAPQVLTGRHGPLPSVPEERRRAARLDLRDAIVERFAAVREFIAANVPCLLRDCDGLAILNDDRYLAWRERIVAECNELCEQDQTSLSDEADSVLDIFGRTMKSLAVAARFGVALERGPKALSDLTEIALEVHDLSSDGMDRAEYLGWRKRTIRWIDAITYVDGLPCFEHTLKSGQIVYDLLGREEQDNGEHHEL